MSDDVVIKEYFALLDTVRSFDERLMTIKGWGITLSLASLGLGFQTGHSGLFLVAALSGIAFWSLETAFKVFQMRYYVRMREIEIHQSEFAHGSGQQFAAPQIDWSWHIAPEYFLGHWKPDKPPTSPERYEESSWYKRAFFLPQVYLPHVISVVAGIVLFALGTWGTLLKHT